MDVTRHWRQRRLPHSSPQDGSAHGLPARVTSCPPQRARRPTSARQPRRPTSPGQPGCLAASGAPSYWTPPMRYSPRGAITPPRWTTSPRWQAFPKPVLYQHFSSKLDLYLALLDSSCERLVDVVRDALASTDDNADRVVATVAAFYEFVSSASGEFRFVFESDLTGDGAVQERLWRVNNEIADAIADVIAEDTALPAEESKLLAISLVGIAQVSARYWVSPDTGKIPLDEAKQLAGSPPVPETTSQPLPDSASSVEGAKSGFGVRSG